MGYALNKRKTEIIYYFTIYNLLLIWSIIYFTI